MSETGFEPLVEYKLSLSRRTAYASGDERVEVGGVFEQFSAIPLAMGSNRGGSPLKLGYRVKRGADSDSILFEDRAEFYSDMLEPGASYPFRLRIPSLVVTHEPAAIHMELVKENAYWATELGGRFDLFYIYRDFQGEILVAENYDEHTADPQAKNSEPAPVDRPHARAVAAAVSTSSRGTTHEPNGHEDSMSGMLRKYLAGQRIRYAASRSDFVRARQLRRYGCLAGLGEADADTLMQAAIEMSDWVQRSGTEAAQFFTDAMAASWLRHASVRDRFPAPNNEVRQFSYLAWYVFVRPLENGFAISREPLNALIQSMSAPNHDYETSSFGVVCSPIMRAVYAYETRVGANRVAARSLEQASADEIVKFFICNGAYSLSAACAIRAFDRNVLAQIRSERGPLVIDWITQKILDPRDAQADFGLRDLMRDSATDYGDSRFDHASNAAPKLDCARFSNLDADYPEFAVADGELEYTCIEGSGQRLLAAGEWYPPETTFAWSKAPISTLIFSLQPARFDWFRIGIMFDRSPMTERRVKIRVNQNAIWEGTIWEATAHELILACSHRVLQPAGLNLLQFEVSEAFVPSEAMGSHDTRRLGVGLKRIWVQRVRDGV